MFSAHTIPIADATCASMSLPVTSPMAQTPSTDVANRVPDLGELEADRTGADDDNRFRQPGLEDGFQVGHHTLAVGFDTRDHRRPGPGSNDDVLGLVRFSRPIPLGHADGVRSRELRLAHVHVDFVLLHQETDALDQAIGYLTAPSHSPAVVRFPAFDFAAEVLSA